MITGIDLRHRVHQLMVQLLRLVPRLLIKSKKNSSSSVVRLIRLWRFSPLYFSKATWTIFLSVNLCHPFFHLDNPERTHVRFTLSPIHFSNQTHVHFTLPLLFSIKAVFLFCFLRSYMPICSFVFHDFLNHFYLVPTKIINVKNKDLNCFLRSKDSSH